MCNYTLFFTGESESDHHWVYCSKFLLAGLCHLLMCLEKLDGKNFPNPEDYQQALNLSNLLVRKAEMVFSSHLACWSVPQRTHWHRAKRVDMSLAFFVISPLSMHQPHADEED